MTLKEFYEMELERGIEDVRGFNLQLFSDEETVSLDSLKDHGFSDEELQGLTPQEETVVESVTEPIETAVEVPPVVETPQDSVTVEEEEPHADNLRMALKEERDRRKTLSAELAVLKAKQSQPAPTPPVQQYQPPAQQQTTDINEQIATMADEKIRKALGITDDIETLQYSDPTKYLQYVKGVAKEEFRLESQHEQSTNLRNNNVSFVQELQQQEDFPVLYQFALARLDEIPGKQSRKIGEAFYRIDQGIGSLSDQESIRSFTDECRTYMVLSKTEKPSTTTTNTPTTSPIDKANGLPRSTTLSGNKTSAMSWTQVESLIREGKIDQIPKEMISQIDKRLLE